MEIVSVKFQESVLKKIDSAIRKHDFNSRTEFIREAVRDKMSELEKEELIQKFLGFQGRGKIKTTYEEDKKIREKAVKELARERGWDI